LDVIITIAVSCKSEQITEQTNINADSSLTDYEGNVYKVNLKINNRPRRVLNSDLSLMFF